MQAEERREVILEALLNQGHVESAELSERLGVSEMTIRRDLGSLEAEGVLRRVYGGATRLTGGSYEPPFAVRARLRQSAKEAIARAVAEQIADAETVILDGGSTGLAVASALTGRVITACPLSLRVANILVDASGVRLLLPGGYVRDQEQSFVGEQVVSSLEAHVFDTYVMTASGASPDSGLTEWNSEDAAVKRAALRSARRCILACDASKFADSAFAKIAPLSAPDLLITDWTLGDEMRRLLEEQVRSLLIAH
jgi:DeoR/GlpR family transcriptional regulator of sugar metabolism